MAVSSAIFNRLLKCLAVVMVIAIGSSITQYYETTTIFNTHAIHHSINNENPLNPYVSVLLSDIGSKPHIKIKQYQHSDDYFMSFCTSFLVETGLGNRLGAYWFVRGLSFWWNISFIFNERCTCQKHDWYFCQKMNSTKYHKEWTNYLPHKSSININKLFQIFNESNKMEHIFKEIFNEMNIDNLINDHFYSNYFKQNFNLKQFKKTLLKPIYTQFGHELLYIYSISNKLYTPHHSTIMLSVFNQIFIEFLRFEMELAFYLYFKQNSIEIQRQHRFVSNLMHKNKDIIVVHWRCGDKLGKLIKPKQVFPAISFYKDSINAFKLNKSDNYMVYWLAQLDERKARGLDAPYIDKCREIMDIMKPHYTKLFFGNESNDNLIIISNGTVSTDSYLITKADYAIGGGSSFFQMLSLGNKNHIATLVQFERVNENQMFQSMTPTNKLFIATNNDVLTAPYRKSVDQIVDHILSH